MNSVELLAKADYLEGMLAERANEVGIAELVSWLKEVDRLLLAEYVEKHSSRRYIEHVIANIRDWVRVGEIDRADREAKRYDVNAAYMGELIRKRIEYLNAKPLAFGKKQIASLTLRRDLYNLDRQRLAEAETANWQREAEVIWRRWPDMSNNAVARLLKQNLRLKQAERTIAKKLKKPGTAS